MTKFIDLDKQIIDKLERANYMVNATKSLYLEALERGIACQQSKEEYVRAFVELDKIKCEITAKIYEPKLMKWDADFILGKIKAVFAD